MKRCFAIFGLSLLVLIFAISLPAFAQEGFSERHPGVDQEKPALETRKDPADFGQEDWAYTWLGASDFMQEGVAGRLWSPGGYYGRATDSGTYFAATIKLPSGSEIKRLILYAYDDHAGSNIQWWVVRHWTDLPGQALVLFYGPPTGAEGYSMRFVDPVGFTFDNYHQYVIEISMPQLDANHKFKGVRIAYQRQISPAPATARFPDVPTGHPHFRNIEALAASGITVGYSDGTYRPDNSVTRAEMATFLSRALGLHHPDAW